MSFEQELKEKFPNLYRSLWSREANQEDRLGMNGAALTDTEFGPIPSLCFGIECGEGWHNLILKLSEKLEALILQLPEVARAGVYVTQVKEKYGTLRFYMSTETDEMSDAIRFAEAESEVTCEICGKPGRTEGESWLSTVCPEHSKSN